MIQRILDKSHQQAIEALFTSTFTSSEGEMEGQLMGRLSAQLAAAIDNHEILCFGTYENQALIATIFFTRLHFSNRSILVYMLAPVAVSDAYQGQGIGQALINFGLDELKKRSVDVAVTYGDPAFYSKTGFQSLEQGIIQAPLTLSMPFAWLGQSLTGKPIPVIDERPVCITPFRDPVYW